MKMLGNDHVLCTCQHPSPSTCQLVCSNHGRKPLSQQRIGAVCHQRHHDPSRAFSAQNSLGPLSSYGAWRTTQLQEEASWLIMKAGQATGLSIMQAGLPRAKHQSTKMLALCAGMWIWVFTEAKEARLGWRNTLLFFSIFIHPFICLCICLFI